MRPVPGARLRFAWRTPPRAESRPGGSSSGDWEGGFWVFRHGKAFGGPWIWDLSSRSLVYASESPSVLKLLKAPKPTHHCRAIKSHQVEERNCPPCAIAPSWTTHTIGPSLRGTSRNRGSAVPGRTIKRNRSERSHEEQVMNKDHG